VTIARYDADKVRWRELKAVVEANAASATGTAAAAAATPVRAGPASTGGGSRM